MDYKKYTEYLTRMFEESFTFSKEVALKRDNKLIEGFILKAEEEISFNDFYISGNENILKYSGVIKGLQEKRHEFFRDMPPELKSRILLIDDTNQELFSNYSEHKNLFDIYRVGAEFCLYIFLEEQLKIKHIDNRLLFQKILTKANEISKSEFVNSLDSFAFKKMVSEVEIAIENIKTTNLILENPNFLKKQAFNAVKNYFWEYEINNMQSMSSLEKNAHFKEQISLEKRMRSSLLNSGFFIFEDSSDNEYTIA